MAIGPTGAFLTPAPPAQGGSPAPAPARLARGLQEAFGFRARDADSRFGQPAIAEPLDDRDRRQFNLEQAAEQIRLLNPNAPRGTIVDILA